MAPTKKSGKPLGARSAYGFFIKHCGNDYKKTNPEKKLGLKEMSQLCSKLWAELPDNQRNLFRQQADADKERHRLEMENYANQCTDEKNKSKKKKDPNAPKRPLSAFFWFSYEERNKVKTDNPGLGVADVAKELGRQWGVLKPELKSQYQILSARDMERYKREKADYFNQQNQVTRVEEAIATKN